MSLLTSNLELVARPCRQHPKDKKEVIGLAIMDLYNGSLWLTSNAGMPTLAAASNASLKFFSCDSDFF